MSGLHQKKFYSSDEVDRIVERCAEAMTVAKRELTGNPKALVGYSEALRHIVYLWDNEETMNVPILGKVKDGQVEWTAEEMLKREG